jgi:hypothetical protein
MDERILLMELITYGREVVVIPPRWYHHLDEGISAG